RALGDQRLDRLVVVVAVDDRFFEDRRVRGDPPEPVVVDHRLQLAGGDDPAPDVVVPDALAVLLDFDERIAHDRLLPRMGAWPPPRRRSGFAAPARSPTPVGV